MELCQRTSTAAAEVHYCPATTLSLHFQQRDNWRIFTSYGICSIVSGGIHFDLIRIRVQHPLNFGLLFFLPWIDRMQSRLQSNNKITPSTAHDPSNLKRDSMTFTVNA